MAITFVCPCGKHLRARNEQASRRMLCPGCNSPVTVPALDEPIPETENRPAPVFDRSRAERAIPDPLGPIFFRARPRLHSDPNRVSDGPWVPLDNQVPPPPAKRGRRPKRKRRQIVWRRETNWVQCLLYPFRSLPLVVGLGAALGMFAAHAATYLPEISERLAEEGVSWTVFIDLVGIATVCYTLGLLDCVLVSAVEGECVPVGWLKRSAGLVLHRCLAWLLCFLAGPALFAGAAVAYWLHGPDPDLGDRLILSELSAVAAVYFLLALLATAESGRVLADPQAIAALFRRLGVGVWSALLAALVLAFFFGRFAVNSLEEYHRSWFSGGFQLTCVGVAGVWLAVFFLRYLGISTFQTRPTGTGERLA